LTREKPKYKREEGEKRREALIVESERWKKQMFCEERIVTLPPDRDPEKRSEWKVLMWNSSHAETAEGAMEKYCTSTSRNGEITTLPTDGKYTGRKHG
jgi:hypothetical protein